MNKKTKNILGYGILISLLLGIPIVGMGIMIGWIPTLKAVSIAGIISGIVWVVVELIVA